MRKLIGLALSVLLMVSLIPVTSSAASSGRQDIYRLYNSSSGEHFYTPDMKECSSLTIRGWIYEGIGWTAPKSSNTPVYRLYNPNSGDHHYTIDEKEKSTLVRIGWNYEGIGWYSDDSRTVPLYREYNPRASVGSHNYTTSIEEDRRLTSRYGWNGEGIAWYALSEGRSDSTFDTSVAAEIRKEAGIIATLFPSYGGFYNYNESYPDENMEHLIRNLVWTLDYYENDFWCEGLSLYDKRNGVWNEAEVSREVIDGMVDVLLSENNTMNVGNYNVKSSVVNYVATSYGDVTYRNLTDTYVFKSWVGDPGESLGFNSYLINPDGSITVKFDVLLNYDRLSVAGQCTAILVKNQKASKSMFPYAVKSCSEVDYY